MSLLLAFAFFISCGGETVIQREANTCVTSDKFPKTYIVMRQWGWDIWLLEAGVKDARTLRYVNDKKWRQVECPK
ncbi:MULTISPECIES: hypothetical protein [unclassified Halobacteriovorax]|uniref:hypothetical protein n=1 Tax=unclassified Halobacteriovorax TaxID=2639665 RepID=UPI002FF07E28